MNAMISVIVPVYNVEKYLKECIESILSQTYKNIEIILVDDGSKDSSGKICDYYSSLYKNVKTFHLENGGPSQARNYGLSVAEGEYIGFVDSDDYIDKTMYESMISVFENRNVDLVMCGFNTDTNGRIESLKMNYDSEYKYPETIKNSLISRYCTSDHNGLYSVCNKLFKRDLIILNDIIFDVSINYAEDAWFVFSYLKKSCSVYFLDSAFYTYRQLPKSLMHKANTEEYLKHKNYRMKLEREVDKLEISYDKNEFYYGFLINSISYCRQMMYQKEDKKVNDVLNDEYFRKACRYNNKLPKHFQLICRLENYGLFFLLKILLNVWNLKNIG